MLNTDRAVCRVILFGIFASIVGFPNLAEGQNVQSEARQVTSRRVISRETHNQVLDIVFPRERAADSLDDFVFFLRFGPHSEPELQLTIRTGFNGTVIVEHKASHNVWDTLNALLTQTGREDPREMANQIKVQKRQLTSVTSNQARAWQRDFLESISKTSATLRQKADRLERTGEVTIPLHGAVYELWYEQSGTDMTFSTVDADVASPEITGELAWVRWMNTVRNEIAKRR